MSFDKAYTEPLYLIGEVAIILDIHPQTLRQYEREGLVLPGRTSGKIRQYSQKNIDDIKSILLLTRNEGINLAGVSKILELKKNISNLKSIISEFESKLETGILKAKSY
ncbi:MAG: MerR family transcriptional regulator/heat shock protein HspR [Arcobacteraceae bacterium]|jgi:MerR family transcriptional regulator/heat shock protein HspR